MNVLSLFDGMSCGMIALDRLGIKVDNYYASEIDKYAIQVSQANYPDIIQVGDITKLDLSTLPKIDLVMGGSPCQGFSFAGKQLAFDDPRSALFFEFVKCVDTLKPKYFLLENVRMKKEYLDIISEYMGVEPIFINSSLVSAQSRQRYYWTNIPGIEQPEERGIVLRDILEDQVGSEHYVGDNMQKNYKGGNQLNPNYKSQANTIHNSDKKSGTICAGTHGYANGYVGDKHKPVKQTERNARHLKQLDDKSLCMTATMYKGAGNNGMTLVPQRVGTHVEEVKVRKHKVDITALQYLLREMKAESKKTNRQIAEETNLPITKVEHWFRTDSSFAIPSDDVWFKLKEVLGIKSEVFDKPIMEFEYRDGVYESTQRVYGDHGKSPTLTASNSDQLIQTSDKPQDDKLDKMTTKDGKAYCVTANYDAARPKNSMDRKQRTMIPLEDGQELPSGTEYIYDETNKSHKPQHIGTAVDVRAMTEVRTPEANKIRYEHKRKTGKDWSPRHMRHLVERQDEKMNTLTSALTKQHILQITEEQEVYWRKLTPIECERLQTVPDNYTNHVSNTQRYKMLGNGWTIEVIAHILKNMEVKNER